MYGYLKEENLSRVYGKFRFDVILLNIRRTECMLCTMPTHHPPTCFAVKFGISLGSMSRLFNDGSS